MAVEEPIGGNIQRYRQSRGRSQAVVAGLAGIKEEYLSQIERGKRVPTIGVLRAIAGALGVPVAVLLGEPPPVRASIMPASVDRVYRALTVPAAGLSAEVSLDSLRARVVEAWRVWQSSPTRYTDVAALLPPLIADAEGAVVGRRAPGEAGGRREAARIAADLYFLVRTFCRRAGRVDLSLLAADRSLRCARDADDGLRIAAAHWNLAHALLAGGEHEHALAVAVAAANTVATSALGGGGDAVAMHGALHLVAVAAQARMPAGGWAARERLRDHALPAARRAADRNVLWTAFSLLNVELHAFDLELSVGEAGEALRVADRLDPSSAPSIERRLTFLLDLARANDQRRDDAAVLVHLLEAERTAPEDLRYNPLAHTLVRSLAKRARPSLAPQVARLALRTGLSEG